MPSQATLCDWDPTANKPPASAAALPDVRNQVPVLDFDADTDWSAVFHGVLPNDYAGGSLVVMICWLASSATSNDVVWNGAFERWEDDVTDLDSDSFASPQAVTATAPSASGEPSYDQIVFTAAQIDGLVAGERFRLKITRDANNGSDDMAGDAELVGVHLYEA